MKMKRKILFTAAILFLVQGLKAQEVAFEELEKYADNIKIEPTTTKCFHQITLNSGFGWSLNECYILLSIKPELIHNKRL